MKKIFTAIIILIAALYAAFIYVLPPVMSSHAFLEAAEGILREKTGIELLSQNFEVKTYPSLVIEIAAGRFSLKNDNKELLKAENAYVKFDVKTFKIEKAVFDYIYLNRKNFKNTAKAVKKKSYFNLKKIPELIIKKAEIEADNKAGSETKFNINNIRAVNSDSGVKITFEAEIISSLLSEPVYAGKKGFLTACRTGLYAENIEILSASSKLYVNGKVYGIDGRYNFSINADDFPAADIAAGILYMQKKKEPGKKFIENFYNFSGLIDADLKISNNGIEGTADAENLAAETVLFNVPVSFKKVPFIFKGREISAAAYGILGGERVYSDFKTVFGSKGIETQGSVKAQLTNKSVSKYVPNAGVQGNIDAAVNYHIKDKKVNVTYNLSIPENSDIFYHNAYLGIIDTRRRIYAETLKDGDKLKLLNYKYSSFKNGAETVYISGNGLFEKEKGVIKPVFITAQTINDAPVSSAGSFYRYLHGGVYSGKLKYDFKQNKVTGNFEIKNSKYKHYHIERAYVDAHTDAISIKAEGKYKNSRFKADISGKNDFNSRIKIYNLYLFLDELNVKTKPKSQEKSPKANDEKIKIDEKTLKSHTDSFDIDLYTLQLNRLNYRRAVLTNILLKGSIHDNVFNFEAPQINFAGGVLTAKGFYDFEKRISESEITADDIDADTAADTLFNLPGQISGTADAVFKIKTSNGINKRESSICFDIKKGYLTRLGTAEFMIKKAKLLKKTFTLDDILNIDMKNMKEFASDIEGSFNTRSEHIENIRVTSSNKYISFYIEGNYNAKTKEAHADLFGRYDNNTISKIKIYFIPLSIVLNLILRPEYSYGRYKDKIEKIPVLCEGGDIRIFRMQLNGNPSDSSVKTEFRRIK